MIESYLSRRASTSYMVTKFCLLMEVNAMEDNSRVARKQREKNEPKRTKWASGLVTLRGLADFSRVATWLEDLMEKFDS